MTASSWPRTAKVNSMPCDILGISAFYHDSAACLVRDGEIVAAAQAGGRVVHILKGETSVAGELS